MEQSFQHLMGIYQKLNQSCSDLCKIRNSEWNTNQNIQKYLRLSEEKITEAMADLENAMTEISAKETVKREKEHEAKIL